MHAFFSFAHMQDILPILAPAALAIYAASLLQFTSVPGGTLRREASIVLLLVLYLIFNMTINRSLVGTGVLDFFRHQGRLFYVIALLVIFFAVRPGYRLEERLYSAAIYVGATIAALSLLSFLVGPFGIGRVQLSSETRLLGVMGGHNPTAGNLGLLLLVLAAAMQDPELGPLRFKARPGLWVAGGLILVATLAARSRGYTIALLLALGYLFLPSPRDLLVRHRITTRRVAFIALLGITFLAGAGALATRLGPDVIRDPNVLTRLALFARAARMGLESPLTGLGLGTFEQTDIAIDRIVPGVFAVRRSGRYVSERVAFDIEGGLHAHNVYLQLFAEVGLIGLGLVAWLLIAVLLDGRAILRRKGVLLASDETARACFNARLTTSMIIFLGVAGMAAGYTFQSPGTSWLLWIAMGRLIRQRHAVLGRSGEVKGWIVSGDVQPDPA
jgi:O-antigen ligase